MAKIEQFPDSGNNFPVPKKFPIEVFPQEIIEIIQMQCDALNMNLDYACVVCLFAFASAIGTSYALRIKNGWEEMAIFFVALVGKPGINKSAPISVFTRPLEIIDTYLYEMFRQEWKKYKKQKLSKDESERLEEPIRRQVIIQDATQEALFQALYHNQRGLAGIFDELVSFLSSFNKYRSGGGDEEKMLSIFSGKSISINRKNSEPILIPRAFYNVIGSIQPQVLVNSFGNKIDNGFAHRFLYVYPDGVRRESLSENDVAPELTELYEMLIKSLIKPSEILSGNHITKKLGLSKEAMNIYKKNVRSRIDEIINNEKSDGISGIYAKLDTYFFRLALVIHIMRLTCMEEGLSHLEVSACSAERAEKLVDYFEYMALKVFKLMERHRDPLMNYPLEHKILYYQLPQQFTTEEAIIILKQSSVKTSERTLFNLLSDQYLFTKIRRGYYEKVW